MLASLALLLAGCHHTMYRDVYSPHRNYYVPPKEKSPVLPVIPESKTGTGAPKVIMPDPGLMAPPGGLPPAAPGLPGMEALPPPPAAAPPPAQ